MSFCPRCGAQQTSQSNFCSICGNPLNEPQESANYAPPAYNQPPVYNAAPAYSQPPVYAPNPGGSFHAAAAANLKSAKNFALISLILCVAGLLLDILRMVILKAIYEKQFYATISPNYTTQVVSFVLIAVIPVLAMCFATMGKRNCAKGLQIGAVCVLCVQIAGNLLRILLSLVNTAGIPFLSNILSALCQVFYYIGGTNVLSSIFSLFTSGSFFIFSTLVFLLSGLCYLLATVMSFMCASRLKKT